MGPAAREWSHRIGLVSARQPRKSYQYQSCCSQHVLVRGTEVSVLFCLFAPADYRLQSSSVRGSAAVVGVVHHNIVGRSNPVTMNGQSIRRLVSEQFFLVYKRSLFVWSFSGVKVGQGNLDVGGRFLNLVRTWIRSVEPHSVWYKTPLTFTFRNYCTRNHGISAEDSPSRPSSEVTIRLKPKHHESTTTKRPPAEQ